MTRASGSESAACTRRRRAGEWGGMRSGGRRMCGILPQRPRGANGVRWNAGQEERSAWWQARSAPTPALPRRGGRKTLVVFLGVVDGVLGALHHQILLRQDRQARQARVALQAP